MFHQQFHPFCYPFDYTGLDLGLDLVGFGLYLAGFAGLGFGLGLTVLRSR